MLRIGEKMSPFVNYQKLVFMPNGEIYPDKIAQVLNQPLDTGRLLFAKLRREMNEKITVEVWWNHFDNVITAHMAGRKSDVEVSFREPVMARSDLIVYINDIVERAKEQEPSLLQ